MPLRTGDKLGPYEILALIGAGGIGEVWKARDTRRDRVVAIKLLEGIHPARFEPEARAIADLNHPHICTLYDIGTSPDGSGYLVTEYIDGAPLTGPLPLADALRLAAQIAEALGAGHGKGILHRDVKPANVLVTASGAKLLDFGLGRLKATTYTDLTRLVERAALGIASYMSPEQVQAKPLDERSDVFAFGAVLYEMLSGHRAFSGRSILDTLNAVVQREPAPLESPAANIVRRCLAKSAAERFPTMAEVRAALDRIAAKRSA